MCISPSLYKWRHHSLSAKLSIQSSIVQCLNVSYPSYKWHHLVSSGYSGLIFFTPFCISLIPISLETVSPACIKKIYRLHYPEPSIIVESCPLPIIKRPFVRLISPEVNCMASTIDRCVKGNCIATDIGNGAVDGCSERS